MSAIHVLEHKGVSYFKIGYVYGQEIRVNKETSIKEIPNCLGDSNYKQFNGKIHSLEQYHSGGMEYCGWKMKESYSWAKDKFPEFLPEENVSLSEDEDGWLIKKEIRDLYPGILIGFYERVTKERPGTWSSLEFFVIDRNCQPTKMLPGVSVLFPHNLREYPETHHKFPCEMGYEQVFNYLHDKVEEIVKNSDGKYEMTDYKSIQTLTVSEVIKLADPINTTATFYRNLRSRKTSTRPVTYTTKKVVVFGIKGKYTGGSEERTIKIEGKNYEEFLVNLENYVSKFTGKLTKTKREECPRCKGLGMVEVK